MSSRLRSILIVSLAVATNACAAGFASNGINTANLQTVDFSRLSQMKSGESCATTVLGLFTDGSALISDAARVGGLKRVDLVEYKVSVNPLFSKQCAIVYGN